VNSLPARLAGGNPSDAGDGDGPERPPFAPEITTTATIRTITAKIGIPTRVTQPRKWSPARNSADQLRLAGGGKKERTSVAHSVPAAAPRWLLARDSRGREFPGGEAGGREAGGREPVEPESG
jgi:hypothetical protein